MNTIKGKARFKNFFVLLDSGCSYTIVIGRLVKKLYPEEDSLMQWYTQAGNITTNINVKVYFTLPALSATNIMTWKFPVDDSYKGRYNMILGKNILTEIGLNLK